MKRTLALSLFAVVLFAASAGAQTKPNFAGTWKMTSTPPADGFASATMVVAQTDKVLTVTATSQMGEIKTTYNLDGSEARSPLEFNGNTMDRTTKLTWDAGRMVLTSVSDFGGTSFEVKQVWSLADDGTLTLETTRPDFQGGGGPVTSKATYKKG